MKHILLYLSLLFALPWITQAQTVSPRGDVGANITGEFAACTGGTADHPRAGCTVNVGTGTYYYATPIVIPNNVSAPYIVAPELDCHGAQLIYTGSGDGVTVMGESATGNTGEIRNCVFIFQNPAATFHLWSRIFFKVSHCTFILGSTGITIDNDLAHGGTGFTEEQHWTDIEFVVNPDGGSAVSMVQDPSLTQAGSFFYNFFDQIHLDLYGSGSSGFYFGPPVNGIPVASFGSYFDIHVNTGGGSNDSVFKLGYLSAVTRGVVYITGENTGGGSPVYDVSLTDGSGAFENFGSSNAGFGHNYNGATQDHIQFYGGKHNVTTDIATGYGTSIMSGEAGGTNPGRQCYSDYISGTTAVFMASLGGAETDCSWGVYWRHTGDAIAGGTVSFDAGLAGTSGYPVTSLLYADPFTRSVGIGPGFSPVANVVSGVDVNKPLGSAEVRGGLVVRNPLLGIVGNGGAFIQRSIDNSGNAIDNLSSFNTPGQPSNHYLLTGYSAINGTSPTMLDCFVASVGYCTIANLTAGSTFTLPVSTPANSSAGCNAGQMWTDPNYVYVCTATNQVKRVSLASF